MRGSGRKHPRKGPKIARSGGTYDTVFSFSWPIFPVEVTDDPDRIREAWDPTPYYMGDPSTESWEDQLRHAAGGPIDVFPPKEPLELVEGPYLIPTSSEPRMYSPLSAQPRPLDKVLSMEVDHPSMEIRTDDDIIEFVAQFGFLGATRRIGHPSAHHGEALKHVRDYLRTVIELTDHWDWFRTLKQRPDEPLYDHFGVIPRLNDLLMQGTGPTVRVQQSDDREGLLSFTTGFTCRSLFDALLLQFYLDLAETREYEICPGCGDIFAGRHGNQKYCSQDCGDRARHRKSYKNERRSSPR